MAGYTMGSETGATGEVLVLAERKHKAYGFSSGRWKWICSPAETTPTVCCGFVMPGRSGCVCTHAMARKTALHLSTPVGEGDTREAVSHHGSPGPQVSTIILEMTQQSAAQSCVIPQFLRALSQEKRMIAAVPMLGQPLRD